MPPPSPPPPPPPPPANQVQIDVNDTPDKSDNVTLFNPPFLAQPYTQTIPAKVTNLSDSTQTIQLSVSSTGTGAATLSQNTVILPAGASTEVTITPQDDSSAPNDVHIIATVGGTQVAEDDMTVATVTVASIMDDGTELPGRVRNPDTPAAMRDRIPPRVDTPIHVDVRPDLSGSGQHVTLAVNNQDNNNGTVTLNGAATADITSSH